MEEKVYIQNPGLFGRYINPRRISWSAIFAGVVIILVVQLLLSLLGIAVGGSTIDPMEENRPFQGLGTGTIIWWIVSNLIAIFCGGYIAGRLSGVPPPFSRVLHGVLTWAVYTFIMVILIASAAGQIIGGAGRILGATFSVTGRAVAAVAPEITKSIGGENGIDLSGIKSEFRQLLAESGKSEELEKVVDTAISKAKKTARDIATNPQQAGEELDKLIESLFKNTKGIINEADREAVVNIIVERTGKSRAEANQIVNNWINTYQQAREEFQELQRKLETQARETGGEVAEAVAKGATYSLITLILGAITAGVAGGIGKQKDVVVEEAKIG